MSRKEGGCGRGGRGDEYDQIHCVRLSKDAQKYYLKKIAEAIHKSLHLRHLAWHLAGAESIPGSLNLLWASVTQGLSPPSLLLKYHRLNTSKSLTVSKLIFLLHNPQKAPCVSSTPLKPVSLACGLFICPASLGLTEANSFRVQRSGFY